MNYRKEIDGLRAIAVLAVILFHAGFEFLKGGFLGVDIFFVISGFLMTGIILEEKENGTFKLAKFCERRVRRIFPMLFVTIFICFIPAFFLLFPAELVAFSRSAFTASLAFSNIYFMGKMGNYFATTSEYLPLIHTWTLGVEEQFYIILPLLFIFFWKIGKRNLFLLVLLLCLASFSLNFILHNKVHTFYLLHTRFWELGIGCLAAFFRKKAKPSNSISLAGLILICLTIIFHEALSIIILTFGTALVILFGREGTVTHKILSVKPLTSIGFTSYSSYLIHQPLFVFIRIGYEDASRITYFVASIVIFILAFFTWKFIENPCRNKKVKFKYIACGVLIAIATLGVVNRFIIKNKGLPSRFENNVSYHNPPTAFDLKKGEQITKDCFEYYDNGGTDLHFCNIGNGANNPSYFLTGSSLAIAMSYLFNEFKTNGLFASMGQNCKFLLTADEKYLKNFRNKSGARCILPSLVYDYIKNHKNIKRVFIMGYLNPKDETDFDYTVAKYKEIGVHVFIVQQNPEFDYMAFERHIRNPKHYAKFALTINEYKAQLSTFNKLEEKYKNENYITFIKIENIMCDENICSIGKDGIMYYGDAKHPSLHAISLMKNKMQQYVD